MLQRLPTAQVQTDNTSENLLNKIRQIICSLYQAEEITEKVYNNIMNSIKVKYKINTMLMNSGNSNTSESHRLLHNLLDKLNLKRSDKYVALSNLSMYNNIKTLHKNIKFTISAPTWNEKIIYLGDHILRHIFKII